MNIQPPVTTPPARPGTVDRPNELITGNAYNVVSEPRYNAQRKEWEQEITGSWYSQSDGVVHTGRGQVYSAKDRNALPYPDIGTVTPSPGGVQVGSAPVVGAHTYGIGLLGGSYQISESPDGHPQQEVSVNVGPVAVQLSLSPGSKNLTVGIGTNIGSSKHGLGASGIVGPSFNFTTQTVGLNATGSLVSNSRAERLGLEIGRAINLSISEESRTLNEEVFAERLAATLKTELDIDIDPKAILKDWRSGKMEFDVPLEKIGTLTAPVSPTPFAAQTIDLPTVDFGGGPIDLNLSSGTLAEPAGPSSLLERGWEQVQNFASSAWSAVSAGLTTLSEYGLAYKAANPGELSVMESRDYANFGLPGETPREFRQRRGGQADWRDLASSASNAWEAATSTVRDAWEGVTDAASDAWDSVSNAASGAWDSVSDAAGDAWDSASNAVSDAWGGISDALGFGGDDDKTKSNNDDDGTSADDAKERSEREARDNPEPAGADRDGPGGAAV